MKQPVRRQITMKESKNVRRSGSEEKSSSKLKRQETIDLESKISHRIEDDYGLFTSQKT